MYACSCCIFAPPSYVSSLVWAWRVAEQKTNKITLALYLVCNRHFSKPSTAELSGNQERRIAGDISSRTTEKGCVTLATRRAAMNLPTRMLNAMRPACKPIYLCLMAWVFGGRRTRGLLTLTSGKLENASDYLLIARTRIFAARSERAV